MYRSEKIPSLFRNCIEISLLYFLSACLIFCEGIREFYSSGKGLQSTNTSSVIQSGV